MQAQVETTSSIRGTGPMQTGSVVVGRGDREESMDRARPGMLSRIARATIRFYRCPGTYSILLAWTRFKTVVVGPRIQGSNPRRGRHACGWNFGAYM